MLYDYWNNAIFAESGTINIVGNNLIRVGKPLRFTADVPYSGTKQYYIEGYTDTFTIDDNGAASWTQEVVLTRGFDISALEKKVGFSGPSQFTAPGEYTPGGAKGTKK